MFTYSINPRLIVSHVVKNKHKQLTNDMDVLDHEEKILRKIGIKKFLLRHGVMYRQLMDYFTKATSSPMPITRIIVSDCGEISL